VTPPGDAARLREEIDAIEWYHSLELMPGVVTPGWFDLREVTDRIPWPELAGRRCLDVGTFDGFWAFEMERRGAAEVVAIDLIEPMRWDWPHMPAEEVMAAIAKRKGSGHGFEIARDALGSSVKRIEMSVYDLDPAEVGMFDVVYLGSLLLHLRDPVRALERARSVCGGEIVVVDAIDLWLTRLLPRRAVATFDGRGRPWWWKPNLAGLVRMVESAGFRAIDQPQRLYMPPGRGQPLPPLRPGLLASRAGREAMLHARKGDPHAAIRAVPR
jgi:tRNA (mo5U34)-methyltransferase